MASPVEERFVKSSIKGKTVFEFGCAPGRLATELSKMGYKVTGIDMYDVDFRECYGFIKADLGDAIDGGLDLGLYDNVIAVSSIEHCGIERNNFGEGDCENKDYHYDMANLLSMMVAPEGQLIVTVPFGDGTTYFVDINGLNGTRDEISKPHWGYRTFNKKLIMDLFPGMDITRCMAYGKKNDGDYFNMLSWEEVPIESYLGFNNKKRAVMCCVFKPKTEV